VDLLDLEIERKKTLDNLALHMFHLHFHFYFLFLDVSKYLFILFLETSFDMFQFMLELVHICVIKILVLLPPLRNFLHKVWMTDTNFFKSGRFRAREKIVDPFQRNGPMI
jgi:hypothetical protein